CRLYDRHGDYRRYLRAGRGIVLQRVGRRYFRAAAEIIVPLHAAVGDGGIACGVDRLDPARARHLRDAQYSGRTLAGRPLRIFRLLVRVYFYTDRRAVLAVLDAVDRTDRPRRSHPMNAIENTSGQGPSAPVPAAIDRWNWGAFLLNWIWGI